MEFRLLSDHEDVATFPSSLHRSHRESAVVALLIRGLNIRWYLDGPPPARMHGGRIRYQSAARNVRATGKRNVERPGCTRHKHAYEVRPRKDKRGVDPIFDALPFGLLWYGEHGLRSRTESVTRSFTVQRIAVIRAYDDDGDVIETHEHAGDFRQF